MTFEAPNPVDKIVDSPEQRRVQSGGLTWVWFIIVGVVLIIVGLLVLTNSGDDEKTLGDTVAGCGLSQLGHVEDNEHTAILDTQGEDESSGDAVEDIACVLNALSMPRSIVAKIDNTRALDGIQSDTWDNYEATWSYHPNSGLNLILEES